MAFTTTASHNLTASDIITEAMETIGVLEEGESPSADQLTSAMRTLNNIIKLWSADTQIYAQAEYTLDLVASTGAYTLSASNVGYTPNKILNATLIDTTTNKEVPLTALTQQEWYALPDKTTEGTPSQYFAQRQVAVTGMALNIWPVPSDTTYDINLWLQFPYRDVTASTDDIWFPQEWYLPLAYELAALIGFKNGIHPQEIASLHRLAAEFRWEASTYDTDGSVFLQPSKN